MNDLLKRLKKCAKDKNGQPLVCYGCSHSAAFMRYTDETLVEGTDFPGKPSGERPCCFCIRNTEREEWVKNNPNLPQCWYDGSKTAKVPMDCYHSVDMLEQIDLWEKENKYEN